jgi:adenosylcobinamide-GDP ribazoletransferase
MSDEFQPRSERLRRFRPFTSFLVAVRFLTRLPVPFLRTLDPPPLSQSMALFPVAGALIGGAVGAVLEIAAFARLPPLACAVAALGAGALITGALHEDGLSDMADGFGGGATREDRLDIMRDSRIGAYGALALVLVSLARASLFATLLALPRWTTIALLACAAAFSRALIVDFMWATRPARRDGLSVMAGRPGRNTTLAALALGGLGAGFASGYLLSPAIGLVSLVAGGTTLGFVRWLAMRKIGGQTGDVIGAAQVLSELAMLAVYAAAVS